MPLQATYLIFRCSLHRLHFASQGLDSFPFTALFGPAQLVTESLSRLRHSPLEALSLSLQRPTSLLSRSLFSLSRLLLGAPNLRFNAALRTWIAITLIAAPFPLNLVVSFSLAARPIPLIAQLAAPANLNRSLRPA